jgi:hypothetical protein
MHDHMTHTVPQGDRKSPHDARHARAGFHKISVNFLHASRARGARQGLTVYPPSRTLEPLAFNEYCRFETSAFFMRIKRASLYTYKESGSIKSSKRQYSSKAKDYNICDFLPPRGTV